MANLLVAKIQVQMGIFKMWGLPEMNNNFSSLEFATWR